jgi:hypothetical protein
MKGVIMGLHIKAISVVPIIINLCMLIGLVTYVLKSIKSPYKGNAITSKSVKKQDDKHVIVLKTYKAKKRTEK